MIPWIDDLGYFPDSINALTSEDDADGLLCASTHINTELLDAAYSKGIYPWYSAGDPVLWWTPSQRAVLKCADFKLSSSLKKTIKHWQQSGEYEVRFNLAFDAVLNHCANRPGGTWMQTELRRAYTDWHKLGAVHSVETWRSGELIGGFYGVSKGTMFYGESMFSRQTDASKVALACFVQWFTQQGGDWIDCQQDTAHMVSLGAKTMARSTFELGLNERTHKSQPSWDRSTDLLKSYTIK